MYSNRIVIFFIICAVIIQYNNNNKKIKNLNSFVNEFHMNILV